MLAFAFWSTVPILADTPAGGQTSNGSGAAPAQAGNRDANQPAMRQKSEINNTSPSFPTAVNPSPGNPPAPSPDQTPAAPATQPSPVVPPPQPNPATTAANLAVQQAQTAYDAQRNRVIAALQEKPEFKAAMARKDQASTNVSQVAPATSPTDVISPAVVDAASAKLNVSTDVTKMQEQAVAADSAASAAKAHLDEALSHRDKLSAGVQP